MPVAIKPFLGCNINCLYCFEAPLHPHLGKQGLEQRMHYDLERILEQIRKARSIGKRHFGLHGGEATMVPKKDMEIILSEIRKDPNASVGIQTNGYLIDDEWIELFKKYRVGVGVSIDGEGELNMARGWFDASGNRKPHSKEYTERVMNNIIKMKKEGLDVSIICVLNRYNALPEPRKKLKEWLLKLKSIGVTSGRLNLAFINDPTLKPILELTPEEAKEAWIDLAQFVLENNLMYAPFREMIDNLLGFGLASCHFTACDPTKTDGEVVIGPEGEIQNCSRLSDETGARTIRKGGLEGHGEELRSILLREIPMSEGGCGGCRYWSVCFGGCPAQGWDWNENKPDVYSKDRFCTAIKGLYEYLEKRLKEVMPNIRTVPDVVQNWTSEKIIMDKDRRLANKWNYRALGYMMLEYTKQPSSYSVSAIRSKREKPLVMPVD